MEKNPESELTLEVCDYVCECGSTMLTHAEVEDGVCRHCQRAEYDRWVDEAAAHEQEEHEAEHWRAMHASAAERRAWNQDRDS